MLTQKAVDLEKEITVTGNPTTLSDRYDVNLTENGYYQMKVEDAAGNTTTTILCIECLSGGPSVSLYTADNVENQLFYCVGEEDNEIPLKEAAVYSGKVTATVENDSIQVEGKEPLMRKSYTTETMDSGTVVLDNSIDVKEFTIVAQDVTGKISHYVYTDETCLNSLVVGNAEDIAYGVKLNEEFKPYQRNYTVEVPYGYPENRVPEVNVTHGNGVNVNKIWDGDVLTIQVTKGDMENTYTITLKRKKCTCDIQLRTYDDYVNVPKTGERQTYPFDVQTDVTLCEVHQDHTQENVALSYQIVGMNYVGEETPSVETADAETAQPETLQVETQIAEIKGDAITFGRIPEGERPVNVRVKATAKTASCERSEIINYTVRNRYDVGLYVTSGGKVQCGEDTLVVQGEKSPVESGDIEMAADEPYRYEVTTGFELELAAAEREGYEFAGWYDSSNTLLSTDKNFVYIVGKDESLHALFKDVVAPEGTISLTDLNGAQNVMASDEGDILVSPQGFRLEISGEDEHSGVESISYQIVKQGEKLDKNGKWIPYNGTPVTLTDEMDFVVYAKIVDQDENETILSSERAMIEKSAASIHMAPNFTEGVFTNKKDAAIVTTVQRGTAALKEIRYEVNGVETMTTETAFGIDDLPDGTYDVTVYATDIFGKEVSAKVAVKKDTKDPILVIRGIPTTQVEQATLTIETDGGISGVKEVRVNGTPYEKKTYKVDQNGTYVFELENNAGSVVAETVSIESIVKPTPTPTAPTVTPAQNPSSESTAASTKAPEIKEPNDGSSVLANKKQLSRTTFVRRKNVGKRGVRITWKGVRGAVSYNVYRAKKAGGTYRLVANVKESSYTSKKKNARKYYYKVVAVAKNKKNNSPMSAYAISVKVDQAAAAATGTGGKVETLKGKVTGVKVKAKKGSICVSWKKYKKADGYIVYRAESRYGVYDEFAVVTKNSFKDTYSVKGRKFYYKVRAFKKKGDTRVLSGISKKASTKAR